MTREPFPLQWPPGWPRTPNDERRQSRFHSRSTEMIGDYRRRVTHSVSLVDACKDILYQLGRLDAVNIAITSNLPAKRNGTPYATGRTDDPGIAVWWVQSGKEQVMACDSWLAPAENAHAIAKTLDALRGIERWGSTAIVQKAFAGFAALPPAGGDAKPMREVAPEPERAWMGYFHVSEVASRAIIKNMYRALAKQLHPDRAHGTEPREQKEQARMMADLNVAWDQAVRWFDWRDAVMGVREED